jgi:DNA-binding CsgD family transcriptional regulator
VPGVVVGGPPGIGRTSIATAVAARLRARGADVVLVRVTTQTGLAPLAALAPLVDERGIGRSGGPVAVDRVSAALRERAATGRFVVIVDDAHRLDPASVTVLIDLVDTPDAFVLATAPDHQLANRLLTHPTMQRLDLGQLDVPGVGELLAAHGADVADAATWCHRTGGNPNAVIRLLSLGTVGHRTVPSDVLDVTLSTLDPSTRGIVDVIAVAEPLPIAALAMLVPDAEPDELLRELHATRMFTVDEEGGLQQLRFLHEADAAAIVALLPPLRLRSVVGRALKVLDQFGAPRTPGDLVKVTALALDVGHPVTAAQVASAAAAALGGRDAQIAHRLARAAAAAPGASPEDLRRYVDLAYERGGGDALTEALEWLAAYVDAHPEDDATVAGAALVRANEAFWRHGELAVAEELLTAAADATDRSAELDAVRARLLAASGRLDDAVALAEPVLHTPEPRARHQAAVAISHARRRAGRPGAAIAVIDQRAATDDVDDPILVVSRQVLNSVRTLGLSAAGRWADAAAEADSTRAAAERTDDRSAVSIAAMLQALVAVERGHLDGACRRAADAASTFAELAQPVARRWALSVEALGHALAGNPVDARLTLADLETIDHPAAEMLAGLTVRAQAWTMARTDPATARHLLIGAFRRAEDEGDLVVPLTGLVDLIALDGAADAAAWLATAATPPDEPAWTLVGAIVSAAAGDDIDELGRLADHLATPAVGGNRWAVELAAVAARSAGRRGDRRTSQRWAERAASLQRRCPGLAATALADVRAVADGAIPLSVRERDVALLAATGATSREIGERLGISARTVDQHLANCFSKLGVSSRSELGARLAP